MSEKDRRWFDEIYKATAPSVRRYAMSLHRAFPWLLDDPEDIVQEVYLCLYEKRDKIYDPSKISAWLLRTTLNKTFSSHKKYQFRKNAVDYNDEYIHDSLPQKENDINLETYTKLCEKRIGKKNFELLQAYYIDKKPLDELAQKEGVAVGTMRVRMHRWRKRCAQVIRSIAWSELLLLVSLISGKR